jgi:aminoglycoside phosphotransferase (APT) family kinase protein
LPFRPRPIAVDHFAYARRKGWMPTTPLLQAADDVIRAHGLPLGETVFVHGDVWPGNLLSAGDEVAALVDWKTAGVGAPGVDVSELRKQVAIISSVQKLPTLSSRVGSARRARRLGTSRIGTRSRPSTLAPSSTTVIAPAGGRRCWTPRARPTAVTRS